ncbi:NHLP family bacteriocin export ABC transporter peptidase/permease/ATPase subunit [Murimonas intestini]|uniref:NHLM bacteriocin system ABC transporter peptidase/ATP-binding protein n=1 Tax=Murimonas intestini TaxID=1337051 RepID=A0AB73T4M3_9FIRM|nr:NHLP family bacteriocin export ABC transporter peptidase/permease/ATPase subunit [Murimonas intestini]MCR1840582.1 NHLP family bacteriocin export ABC transporter peptidase/permease/ATPase subunit [Murimonas intestini]MCR1865365.1 NHLP family bacteriocin export ABC transporter peptidase/permease/ATPase subunit [Murimonas intestini]MCR1882924.1 NHLP family bacteriocin export ABC transporter peptidase/permease/ATPase subunit [Murimonas intestini]
MKKKIKIKTPIKKGVARVPVVMQLEVLECGAASLAMIMAYYGKWVPLEQVRADCGVSRNGSNARNILRAARSYGFTAKAYRYEPEDLMKNGIFPCIIHWNYNHFVVLDGFRGGKAYLNDPARGTCSVSMDVFDSSFTGICLMFEPGGDFVPGGKPKSMFSFAKSRLKGTGTAIAFVVLTTVITSLFGLINPAFSRIFLDRLLPGKNPDWFLPFILALGGIAVVQLVAEWIHAVYSLRISGKLSAVGSTSFMWQVLRMPMEFFSQRMAGDIQQRAASNAAIAETLVNTFAPLALNTVMMVFYLVVMARYSLILTIVGVVSIIINLLVSQIISRKRINITRVQMRDAGKLAGATVAGIEMIETIKASGAENGYFEKWSGYQASVNTQRVKYAKLDQMLGIVPPLVSSLADTAVLILGVYLTMNGEFTVGMIMAFQGFLTSFTDPAMKLVSSGQVLQEMRTEMERVEDVMKYPTDINYEEISEEDEYRKLSGCIEMKNVTFGYSKLDEPLIKDFSLSLKTGSRVAFVGTSGCGKSTLSKLISGLYKPWSGEILFDGKPVDKIDRSVFTSSLAVVDQDIILFEDTIANNIKMWDSSIEDFEMIMAARDAQLHEDIMQRDGGYQYMMTEGGKDFSGGQRQRIEIARVLAQDPTIIILDEATSALDAKTEYDVVRSIKDRGITCIVVAHRLSTIRDCDEIIVLDYGKVVERGTHEELYAKGGIYAHLVSNE